MGFPYKAKGSIWLWHLHSLQLTTHCGKKLVGSDDPFHFKLAQLWGHQTLQDEWISLGKWIENLWEYHQVGCPTILSAYQQVSRSFSPTWSGPKIKVVKCIMGELHPSPRVFLAMFAGFFVDVLGGRCFFWGHWGPHLAFLSVALFWGCINGVSKIFEPTKNPNESCKTYPVTVDELTPRTEDQLTF